MNLWDKYQKLPLTSQILIAGGGTLLLFWGANKVRNIVTGAGAFGGFGSAQITNDPFTAGGQQGQGNTDLQIKNLVDRIVEATNSSANYVGYYYPEVINRLANLSQNDLYKAVNYYNSRHKATQTTSLYDLISNEWAYNWDFTHMYQPAIDALERYNLTF